MRIAFVYRNLNRSGSLERDSIQLVEGLAARGVEMHCYCDPALSQEIPDVTLHPVRPATRSRSRLGYPLLRLSFAARATKAIRADRARYDLVHVLGVAAWEHDVVHVPAVMAAEQKRWPEEGGASFRAASLRAALAPVLRPEVAAIRTIERLQFRPGRYARLTAVTERVRADLARVHGVDPDSVDVVPPSVDVARFATARDGALRDQLGIAADSQVILFIGHAFERKGLEDAIAVLAGTQPSAHLVVVGDGRRDEFERAAEALGLRERVHFVGGTVEPETYYAAADVLLFPTRSDPWGLPVIEAMAAGLPVVTTSAAGSAKVAEEAGAAFVAPPRAREALGRALVGLLDEPELRHRMGERGRAEAARFSLDATVDATLQTYERALDAKARRVR
ncbi:MAG: glycosyltransferase family 4 protein [Gaiellaceae bacterium]